MTIRPDVRALSAYRFTPRSGDGIIELDQNEGPLDLPRELRERALRNVATAEWNRYPDVHPVGIEQAVARTYAWDANGVVVTNGSNVLLQALTIVAGIGRTVLTVTPTFSVYGQQARLLGATLKEVPLADGFALPTAALLEAMRASSGVLFLADPAAPTGNALDPDGLVRLLEAGGDDWLVVLDEAYGDFAGSDHRELVARFPNAVSVRTFSKAASLGGARVGYGLMAPAIATEVRKAVLPFSFSVLQEAVARTVLEEPGYVEERVLMARAGRNRILTALRGMPGVQVYPSVTNFVLFRVADAEAVHEGLEALGIVVRRQDHLPGLEGCLRVSAGMPEENEAFIAALARVLSDPAPASAPERKVVSEVADG